MTGVFETFTSDEVPFADGLSLLGADTNGAAPQRVRGFRVSAEVTEFEGKPLQSFWLTAVTAGDGPEPGQEYVMFADDVRKVEQVLGAVVTACASPGYDRVLKGDFDSYANSAQTAFDDGTSEECIEDLQCRVQARPNGFSLAFVDGDRRVSSLIAGLSTDGIDRTIDLVGAVREWTARSLDLFGERRDEAAPGM